MFRRHLYKTTKVAAREAFCVACTISCIVPKEHGTKALQTVHDAFNLELGDQVKPDQQSDTPKRVGTR